SRQGERRCFQHRYRPKRSPSTLGRVDRDARHPPVLSRAIYIKVRSDETLIFPIHIFDKSYFAQADRKEEFVFGIYYGIILVMFFYNFLLYITLRNRYYFYYLLYVLTLGLYQLALNGIIFQFWPENPGWNKIFLPISQLLLQLTLLLFFKNLLNINRKNRFDYNTILILLGILFLSLGSLSVLEYATIIQPLNTLGILYMVFSIILTVRSYKQGNRTALFFLFNWLTFFVGGITLALRNFGLVPDNFYTTYSLQIGSTLEMLLLSLALADRINRMKDELAVLNTTLEEKVEERTEELLSVLKELRKKNDIIESELELASDIQKCIMPHKDLELSFLKVAVHCEYLTSVGGDYFDILPSKKNNMGVLIADVSGHGIPAALLTTMAKISFMNAMGKKESPIEVFKEVDRNISEIITTQNYLTAFLLVVSKDGKLSFSSAGHRPAIVYRRDQERMDEFKTEGLFLGILEKDKDYFTQKSDKVNRGDRILLYTDGIIDAFDSEEERWGEDRLLQCFQESVDLPVTEARDYIIGKWKEYVGEMGMVDDSTLILLEYQPDTEDTTQKSTR
ncbi:MAG: 7TM diverse intracellular signaling domain-containing protein, partial [Spirochaetota bacterium]